MTSNTDQPVTLPHWNSIAEFLAFWLEHNPLTGVERATFDKYYTGYRHRFSPYIRHHFGDQSREISEEIRARTSPRVLEVGAGCGTESLWFSLLGADVTAIDVAPDRLAAARARLAWLNAHRDPPLRTQYLEKSLFDYEVERPFDLIWMEQAFHHLEPREKVYGKLLSLLAPGGKLVISESNAWNPPMQLLLFKRRGFKTKTSFIDSQGRRIEYGNERITTPGAMRRGLTRSGFSVKSIRHFRMLPNSDPPGWWLGVESGLVGALPFLATHFNIVAEKSGHAARP
jgi:SAM-dependent methyltransferase